MSKFLDAMTHFERRLMVKVGRSRNAMLSQAASAYPAFHDIPQWITTLHRDRIERELKAHYAAVIPYFGTLALSQIKRRKSEKKSYESLVSRWIAREAVRKARMITDTDRDSVRDVIKNGFEDGLGVSEIARNIRRVSDSTARRSLTVARTETHAAATFGSVESVREAEQELGVKMLKRWLPTRDDRTRPDHLAMENHPAIPLDEKFNVGGSLMDRPGDPSAPAEQVINCRCALIYEEAE